jgi:hypothetical protein
MPTAPSKRLLGDLEDYLADNTLDVKLPRIHL